MLSKQEIFEIVEKRQEEFWRISDSIWDFAELGLEEVRSSKLLIETLARRGFSIDSGVAGIPTAFVASWSCGSGRPVIGFTAEFDALPDLSQKAGITIEDPIVKGAPGHGCCHNTSGAMQALAVVSLQELADKHQLDLTIKFFGCPAEEICVSRPYMIKTGLFDDVDAVIDCHGGPVFKAVYGTLGNALSSFFVHFAGKATHAGVTPWLGRSAADAVELMHAGTERMREHLPKATGINWVTTLGGTVPSVVPEKASTWYYVRDQDENIETTTKWIHDCAKGAALMTQTTFEIESIAATHQRIYNRVLAELLYKNMVDVGLPEYSAKEENYSREVQNAAGVPVEGLNYSTILISAEEDTPTGGCSDVGDVTQFVPTGYFIFPAFVPGCPAHHWTVTSAGATTIAHKGITTGAKVVVMSVGDMLTSPKMLKKINGEFEILRKNKPYHSFLPENAIPPLGFYAEKMERFRKLLQNNVGSEKKI
jgi:aminobenzoyl-glutamate utilization protein B